MPAVPYPPATPFVVPEDHPNRKAHERLGALINGLDWNCDINYWWIDQQTEPVLTSLDELPRQFQVHVLKACVERMVWHRQQRPAEPERSTHYYIGSLLYNLACALYHRKLPYSEADICDILRSSRHSCGHGGDVTPPFEIALAHARANGLTAELLGALREFMSGLRKVGSAKVSHLKRKAGLLFVLDSQATSTNNGCWSDVFRRGLEALSPDEQAKWRQLVLGMTVNDVYVLPKVWRREASRFVQKLGASTVLRRLSAWWPDPAAREVWPIQTGGSHLLKYFIWLLDVAGTTGELKTECAQLVGRLSDIDWKPRERAQKAMIAATLYLAASPPRMSWPALQRMAGWSLLAPSGISGNKIREALQTYCRRHKLRLPKACKDDKDKRSK